MFDLNQSERNRLARFKENRDETLIVMSISLSRIVYLQPIIHKLDMLSLLNGEEVLTFDLNDKRVTNYMVICVQAKDLNIYLIDFEKKFIVKKI